MRVRLDGEWTDVHGGEVLLCAGAVHSPAILLRSGVGPRANLADLPVGEHLQDHPLCALALPLREDTLPTDPTARHTNVCVRYTSGLAGAGRNDMMIVGMNTIPMGPFGLLGVWVNECSSRGSLTLASPDPAVDPIVDERMLDDERDRIRMRDGIRRLLELAGTDAVTSITAGPPRVAPTADAGDTELDDWMLANATDAQHICGTARMGTDGRDSVVDASCRVHGLDRLRVVDASVFPAVPRANTHLAVLAVAERAAALLRG